MRLDFIQLCLFRIPTGKPLSMVLLSRDMLPMFSSALHVIVLALLGKGLGVFHQYCISYMVFIWHFNKGQRQCSETLCQSGKINSTFDTSIHLGSNISLCQYQWEWDKSNVFSAVFFFYLCFTHLLLGLMPKMYGCITRQWTLFPLFITLYQNLINSPTNSPHLLHWWVQSLHLLIHANVQIA